jgi:riboflavin synthase
MKVNVETDLIGRYVERLLQGKSETSAHGSLDLDFLAKNGFL